MLMIHKTDEYIYKLPTSLNKIQKFSMRRNFAGEKKTMGAWPQLSSSAGSKQTSAPTDNIYDRFISEDYYGISRGHLRSHVDEFYFIVY